MGDRFDSLIRERFRRRLNRYFYGDRFLAFGRETAALEDVEHVHCANKCLVRTGRSFDNIACRNVLRNDEGEIAGNGQEIGRRQRWLGP